MKIGETTNRKIGGFENNWESGKINKKYEGIMQSSEEEKWMKSDEEMENINNEMERYMGNSHLGEERKWKKEM